MPAAPSLDDLLDFEREWDRVLVEVLSAQLPWTVHPAHGNAQLVPPYVTAEFMFAGEAPTGAGGDQPQARAASGRMYDAVSFAGAVTCQIAVNRKWLVGTTGATGDPSAAAAQAALTSVRGGLRRCFMPSQALFKSPLRWYQLRTVMVGDASRDIDELRDLDITTQRFALEFAILPESWPAGQ